MSKISTMGNVNDIFFDGGYKEIWRSTIPEELTSKEISYIISKFNLNKESRVLDLMCGYGRHSISLSRQGIPVTAVDNLRDYINEISETVKKENLPIEFYCENIIGFKPNHLYDLAICMGNNLNFFNKIDLVKLLSTVALSLKTKGSLFINTWSLAEIEWKNYKDKSWSKHSDYKFISESRVLFDPTRIESETTLISPDGKQEVKTAIDYIYSLNEMDAILHESGLKMLEVYSVPGKKKFTIGDPRAYIIAEKA